MVKHPLGIVEDDEHMKRRIVTGNKNEMRDAVPIIEGIAIEQISKRAYAIMNAEITAMHQKIERGQSLSKDESDKLRGYITSLTQLRKADRDDRASSAHLDELENMFDTLLKNK